MDSTNYTKQVIEVSSEFIEENKKLCQTRPTSKRGGPYSKNDRQKRRDEVFKLHFESGWSSRKIADTMKINRHTINDDVNYWYSQLSKEWKSFDLNGWFMKQISRMESQRARLLQKLEETTNLQEQITIEKIMLEIDSRITQIAIKTLITQDNVLDFARGAMNHWAKEKNLDVSFIRTKDLIELTPKTRERIDKLINDDRINRMGRF